MKLEKSIFNLIIPLTCDDSTYSKAALLFSKPEAGRREFEQAAQADKEPDQPLWFRMCFAPSPIRRTTQLMDSPLASPDSSFRICRFSLSQRMRETVGIAKNESVVYTISSGRQTIPFRIGKINLWLLPTGFAFITIAVQIDEGVSPAGVLDAAAKLSDIKAGMPIRYTRPSGVPDAAAKQSDTGEGASVRHTRPAGSGIPPVQMKTSMKQIVRALLSLQTHLPLAPYENIGSMKSCCLFCGIGEAENREERETFLSMLCLQRPNHLRLSPEAADEAAKVSKYQTEPYIQWAASQKVLAVCGDLTEGGLENQPFLKDVLPHTVQQNYLPVYLHCLSVLLKEKITAPGIPREQSILKDFYPTAEEKASIRQLLRIPLSGLASEDKINDLFDFVVNSPAWKLKEHLQVLNRLRLKRNREHGEGLQAVPYEGAGPYIFISYSHKNTKAIEETVRTMQSDGFRLWFDKYIEYGNEWDEVIAEKIEACSCMICMVSSGYAASENCKDEHSFAKELDIPRILVYLEDIARSGGLFLRGHRAHSLWQFQYENQEAFYHDLAAINELQECREPMP
ncbi:MAG: toll/interleukin-1 receptor domain-containing protein [Lachnospiraceae bacterium]|nr:toll/interleukin-1 receptor domain-containing protein [Lachnospiraceae bacterium]